MLKLVFRVKDEPVAVFGGLWLGIDEGEEREAESGAGGGKEEDLLGLGFDED